MRKYTRKLRLVVCNCPYTPYFDLFMFTWSCWVWLLMEAPFLTNCNRWSRLQCFLYYHTLVYDALAGLITGILLRGPVQEGRQDERCLLRSNQRHYLLVSEGLLQHGRHRRRLDGEWHLSCNPYNDFMTRIAIITWPIYKITRIYIY